MNSYVNWRDFSRRPEIARLPMHEQKRLYRLELDRTNRLLEYLHILEQQTMDRPAVAIPNGWMTVPGRSGMGSVAGTGHVDPTSDINDYVVKDYIDNYFELADPVNYDPS